MDWLARPVGGDGGRPVGTRTRWIAHARHDPVTPPPRSHRGRSEEVGAVESRLITLDGSKGEGGGQILRTALTLSLLTGRAFRMVKVRANREKPGLRPQHLTALESAARLGGAEVIGGSGGARDLTFRPAAFPPRAPAIVIAPARPPAPVPLTPA